MRKTCININGNRIQDVTPDSFSDGGRWNHMDNALFHAQRMIEEGADILDISTTL